MMVHGCARGELLSGRVNSFTRGTRKAKPNALHYPFIAPRHATGPPDPGPGRAANGGAIIAQQNKEPDSRFKHTWTKGHIVAVLHDGTNDISNIVPLCYQCNFGGGTKLPKLAA